MSCERPTQMCIVTEVICSSTPIAHLSQKSFFWMQPFLDTYDQTTRQWCMGHLCSGLPLPDFHEPRDQGLFKLPIASSPWSLLATNQTSQSRIFLSTDSFIFFSHQNIMWHCILSCCSASLASSAFTLANPNSPSDKVSNCSSSSPVNHSLFL